MLPLNAAVTLLSPDTVGVVLSLEELAVAVAQNTSGDSSEELGAVCRGPELQQVLVEVLTNPSLSYFQVAVQEICLARMLKVLAVVRPLLP